MPTVRPTLYQIVDAQVHIWGADTPERPWPKNSESKPPQRPQPFSKDDLLMEMNQAGVSRAILVPPTWEGERNDLVLKAAHQHPKRFAVMGRLDRNPEAAKSQLNDWRNEKGMLGIRLAIRFEENTARLKNPESEGWLWDLAEKRNVPIYMYPVGLLPDVAKVAQYFPKLKIIIDHMALRNKKGEAAFVDMPDLLALARFQNIAVKASTLPFYSAESYPFKDTHKYIRQVYDAFGPQRMLWGADLTRLSCTYTQAITMFTEEMPWLSESDKEWVMGRSLCEWLDWPLPH